MRFFEWLEEGNEKWNWKPNDLVGKCELIENVNYRSYAVEMVIFVYLKNEMDTRVIIEMKVKWWWKWKCIRGAKNNSE